LRDYGAAQRRWGGAAAFAAVLSRRYRPQPGERVGVLITAATRPAWNSMAELRCVSAFTQRA
jgi:hypothetical protein